MGSAVLKSEYLHCSVVLLLGSFLTGCVQLSATTIEQSIAPVFIATTALPTPTHIPFSAPPSSMPSSPNPTSSIGGSIYGACGSLRTLSASEFEEGVHIEQLEDFKSCVTSATQSSLENKINFSLNTAFPLQISANQATEVAASASAEIDIVTNGLLQKVASSTVNANTPMSFQVCGNWSAESMSFLVFVDEVQGTCNAQAPLGYFDSLLVASVPSLGNSNGSNSCQTIKIPSQPRVRSAALLALESKIDLANGVAASVTADKAKLISYGTCQKKIRFVWQAPSTATTLSSGSNVSISNISLGVSNVSVTKRWGNVTGWLTGYISGYWTAMSYGGFTLAGAGYIQNRYESECGWGPWVGGYLPPINLTLHQGIFFYVGSGGDTVNNLNAQGQSCQIFPSKPFYTNTYFLLNGSSATTVASVDFLNQENRNEDLGLPGPNGHLNFTLAPLSKTSALEDILTPLDPIAKELYSGDFVVQP